MEVARSSTSSGRASADLRRIFSKNHGNLAASEPSLARKKKSWFDDANAALDRVYETVRNDERYRPERFRDAMAGLSRILGS